MPEGKHSPLPWKVGRVAFPRSPAHVWIKCDNPLTLIADVRNLGLSAAKSNIGPAKTEANAELICRAVNSHELLVKALESALVRLKADRDYPPTGTEPGKALFDAIAQAKAALAAAGKGD